MLPPGVVSIGVLEVWPFPDLWSPLPPNQVHGIVNDVWLYGGTANEALCFCVGKSFPKTHVILHEGQLCLIPKNEKKAGHGHRWQGLMSCV